MASGRLFLIFQKIINKMISYSTYSQKLCDRFIEARTITVTRSLDSDFSGGSVYIIAYGGLQNTYDSTYKSSNFSTGNIPNVLYDTLQLQDDDKEEWTKCPIFARNLISGGSGGLKSYYCTTANSSYAYRSFQIAAVQTADKNAQFHGGPVICKYPSILS